MWIWKLAGALMLACSGLGASYELNRRATAALQQNEGIIALLRMVRGQIECFARPISEILALCEEGVLSACGYVAQERPTDFGSLLASLRTYDAPTVCVVTQFAKEFGKGYREDEVRACDYALSLLEERRAKISAELPAKKKRNAALAVCGSLAVALLLL